MKTILTLSASVLFYSCATLKRLPDSNFESGYYTMQQATPKNPKVYVDVKEDSIRILPVSELSSDKVVATPTNGQILMRQTFDIDVMTVPFKFRPAMQNLPRQLTVDFNGSLFLGYRLDHFKLVYIQTPAGVVKKVRHRAITFGAFGGLGTTSITPWTTNNGTSDEYNGFILNRGISLMGGVNNLTVGLGLGWDYLTDRDKEVWIYQNKPWYGLTLSLNLN